MAELLGQIVLSLFELCNRLYRRKGGEGLTLPIKNYVQVIMFTVQETRP